MLVVLISIILPVTSLRPKGTESFSKNHLTLVYLQYLNNCASNKNQYLQAEEYAKIQRLGFWNQQNPVMPWDFRQGKHSNQLTYSPFSGNTSNLPKNYNCPDFTTQVEAQEIFNKYPNDRFDLDRDHDGIACENLPKS